MLFEFCCGTGICCDGVVGVLVFNFLYEPLNFRNEMKIDEF